MYKAQLTKQVIFDSALQLFAEKSYNTVTTREISAAANVNNATLYYYYDSKVSILNDILDEFRERIKKYLILPDMIDGLIQKESPRELLTRFAQEFKSGEEIFMFQCYRIVLMEQFTNERAQHLVNEYLVKQSAKSIEYALNKLMEMDKIPRFDARLYSIIWINNMLAQALKYIDIYRDQDCLSSYVEEYNQTNEMFLEMALTGKVY